MEIEPSFPYHTNIHPLTAYTSGAQVEALMDKAGHYLESFDAQERAALIYVCIALSINRSMTDLLLDQRVAKRIKPDIGKILELLTPAELMCVIECILCNTKKSVFG